MRYGIITRREGDSSWDRLEAVQRYLYGNYQASELPDGQILVFGEDRRGFGFDQIRDRLASGLIGLREVGEAEVPVCPACGGLIPNNEHPGAYPGALSRRDNKTEVCSDCGHREAMEDFAARRNA